MSDWRDKMKQLFSRDRPHQSPSLNMGEARARIESFIENTVLPAFEELSVELRKYGREVEVNREPFMAVLTVFHDGREEYSYAVRGRAYHRFSFAFPEHGPEDAPRILRAEIVQSSGKSPDDRLEQFTRDGIIKDFLAEYAKWMGWS